MITTQISLRGAYGNLHRRRGAGMTSGRNEYLRALAISHDDRRADTAIAEHERFVLRVNAAGDLPAWFFLVWSSCNLTPLSYMPKPAGRTPAETPPRPIVVGEPTQRGFATALTKAGTETYKEYLMPQQLAIGVSDAAGQLVHGLRASLEHSRDHILFVLDAKDAFQTVKRSVVLERMSKITGLEAQTTFWHARHNARPMLLVGPLRNRLFDDDDTRGDSEEGVMQGAPDSPAVYCVATQDELVSLDNAVATEGGTARAYIDDVAVVATPQTGFMAIAECIKNIKTTTGVRIEKVEVYAPWLDARTLEAIAHRLEAERACNVEFKIGIRPAPGSSSAGDTHLMRGVELMRAPIGNPDFEEAFYETKATAVVSKIIDTGTEMLHDRSAAAAHTLLYTCPQHQRGYRMRTCRGDDSILSATARVDEALKHGLLSYSPHDILNDELLARRVCLPVRMNGLGIRSQADLLALAWTGCFVQACEAFTDRVKGLGEVVLPGSFPLLGRLFGDGAFDMGGARFEIFVSTTHCLSSARGLREHWAAMRARAAPEAGATPTTGPLSQGCIRQVSRPQCRRTPATTRHPARAYNMRYASNSSSARPSCWMRR